MSVDRSQVETLCESCLEPKYGRVEYDGMELCIQCFRDEVLPAYDEDDDPAID